jgi:hypothetical protein
VTTENIDRMKNKSSLWMLVAGALALAAMIAYLFFALTLADHMRPDPIPPGKAAAAQSAM